MDNSLNLLVWLSWTSLLFLIVPAGIYALNSGLKQLRSQRHTSIRATFTPTHSH